LLILQDEVEGFKGSMGLFLHRTVPVLFHHYSIFKREEVGVGALLVPPPPA